MNKFLSCLLAAILFVSCDKQIEVSAVILSQNTAEMLVGESIQLNASIQPSDASVLSVTWASTNQSVATVSETGLVTAIADGTTSITASAGGKSSTCSIIVKKRYVEVASIVLNKTEISLEQGESIVIEATVKPDDATDKTVSWDTSDPYIAYLEYPGKIKTVKEGSAIITAKAGDKTAVCMVNVKPSGITSQNGDTEYFGNENDQW